MGSRWNVCSQVAASDGNSPGSAQGGWVSGSSVWTCEALPLELLTLCDDAAEVGVGSGALAAASDGVVRFFFLNYRAVLEPGIHWLRLDSACQVALPRHCWR